MKLAIAALTAFLLGAAPTWAQDGTATPDRGSTAAPPRDPGGRPPAGQSGVGVETPKVDPKLVIDIFKELTRPRPRPAAPPAPPPAEPAKPVVAAPAPVPPPVVVPPPPRAVPAAAPAPSVSRDVKPRPATSPQPPRAVPTAPAPAPIVVAEPVVPAEPVIAVPAEPAPPTPPVAPVRESTAAPPAPVAPAQRSSSLLTQNPWLLLALLAAAAAIGAATAWSRARQIARTRAALSLDPRLDLAEGSCSAGGLALACPPMSIRTRLEFPGG